MTKSTNHQGSHKILVVGGTGFLGAKILGQLTQDATLALRAMSRRGAPVDANAAVQWVRGDLMDPTTLDAALKNVDVVVSSANGYMKETIEADFQGNKNLIEAAARAGVKRFVFLSIVALWLQRQLTCLKTYPDSQDVHLYSLGFEENLYQTWR